MLDYQFSEGEIDINYIRRLRQQIRSDFNSVIVEQEREEGVGSSRKKTKKKNFSVHLDRLVRSSSLLRFRAQSEKFRLTDQMFFRNLKINLSVLDKKGYLTDKNSKICNYDVEFLDQYAESLILGDETDIFLDIGEIEKVYYENMLDVYLYLMVVDKSTDEPILWTNHRVFNDLYELNSGHFIAPLREMPVVNPAEYLQSGQYKTIDSFLKFSFYGNDYQEELL